jgi:predicted DCC family thiol-disulfide oxidoreductase YuxK
MGEHPIILFDGVCNLCTGSVRFVIERDPDAVFRFSSLQSEVGRKIAERHGLDAQQLNTMILIDEDKAFVRSEAALRIARYLHGPWRRAAKLLIIPRVLRDPFYRLIASQRYRIFGKHDSCWFPTDELSRRFLTDKVFIEPPVPGDQKADACL